MWNYNEHEFVKLFRKMVNWEWYTDVNTKVLFLHCILKANWKPGAWHGIKYERGQFITSLPNLARETGLSVRQVRTALKHLKATGEVTDKIYPKFRVITVNSYDSFQGSDRQSDSQVTGKRQASDRQVTADIRNIRNIRTKEEKEIEPAALSSSGDDEDPFSNFPPGFFDDEAET